MVIRDNCIFRPFTIDNLKHTGLNFEILKQGPVATYLTQFHKNYRSIMRENLTSNFMIKPYGNFISNGVFKSDYSILLQNKIVIFCNMRCITFCMILSKSCTLSLILQTGRAENQIRYSCAQGFY